MGETTRALITDDLRDAVALALAGHVNGLASDGLGWYRNEDQVEEFHAQADVALAAVDLPALRGRWVAEALEELATGTEIMRGPFGTTTLRRLAAEYRAGTR